MVFQSPNFLLLLYIHMLQVLGQHASGSVRIFRYKKRTTCSCTNTNCDPNYRKQTKKFASEMNFVGSFVKESRPPTKSFIPTCPLKKQNTQWRICLYKNPPSIPFLTLSLHTSRSLSLLDSSSSFFFFHFSPLEGEKDTNLDDPEAKIFIFIYSLRFCTS